MKILSSLSELQEAHRLTTASLFKLHPIWSKLSHDPTEIKAYHAYMLQQSYDQRLLWGIYEQQRLVAMTISYTLRRYMSLTPPKCPKSQVVQFMQPYELVLDTKMKEFAIHNNDVDNSTVVDWTFVCPTYGKKGLGTSIFSQGMKEFAKAGLTSAYCHTSNPASLALTKKCLGEVLHEVTMAQPFEGVNCQLVRIDLEKTRKTYGLKKEEKSMWSG